MLTISIWLVLFKCFGHGTRDYPYSGYLNTWYVWKIILASISWLWDVQDQISNAKIPPLPVVWVIFACKKLCNSQISRVGCHMHYANPRQKLIGGIYIARLRLYQLYPRYIYLTLCDILRFAHIFLLYKFWYERRA